MFNTKGKRPATCTSAGARALFARVLARRRRLAVRSAAGLAFHPQMPVGSEAVAPTQTPENLASQLSSAREPGTLALLMRLCSDARQSPAVRSALAADAGLCKTLARLQREVGECQLAAAQLLCELGLHLTPGSSAARAPRRSRGISVLALDGGGTRAVLTLQMLKQLEQRSGRRVNELFDVIGGTSTGGILALGIQQGYALDELLELYLSLARLVFRRDPFRHGQLLLTGGTYRTAPLEAILRAKFAPEGGGVEGADSSLTSMLEARAAQEAAHHAARHADRHAPRGEVHGAAAPPAPPAHAFVVSCLASRSPPEPYLLRNYEYPPRSGQPAAACSRPAARVSPPSPTAAASGAESGGASPAGSSAEPCWRALRATTAAPSFFPGCVLPAVRGEAARVLQDGALLANNPAAVALREAPLLFPGHMQLAHANMHMRMHMQHACA
jgi:hypothetical protein